MSGPRDPGITKNPGLNLKKLRYKMGLTQKHFAKKFGCSNGCISLWENNVYPINIQFIEEFIKYGKKYGFNFIYENLRID